MDLEEGK
jgi:hypothetical protein